MRAKRIGIEKQRAEKLGVDKQCRERLRAEALGKICVATRAPPLEYS